MSIYRVAAEPEAEELQHIPQGKLLRMIAVEDCFHLFFNDRGMVRYAEVPVDPTEHHPGTARLDTCGNALEPEHELRCWLDGHHAMVWNGSDAFHYRDEEHWNPAGWSKEALLREAIPCAIGDELVWAHLGDESHARHFVLRSLDGTLRWQAPLELDITKFLVSRPGFLGPILLGEMPSKQEIAFCSLERERVSARTVLWGRSKTLGDVCAGPAGFMLLCMNGSGVTFAGYRHSLQEDGVVSWNGPQALHLPSARVLYGSGLYLASGKTYENQSILCAYDGDEVAHTFAPAFDQLVLTARDSVYTAQLARGYSCQLLVTNKVRIDRKTKGIGLSVGDKSERNVWVLARPPFSREERKGVLRDLALSMLFGVGSLMDGKFGLKELDDKTDEMRCVVLRSDGLRLHVRVQLAELGACEAGICRDLNNDGLPDDIEPDGLFLKVVNWAFDHTEGALVRAKEPMLLVPRLLDAAWRMRKTV